MTVDLDLLADYVEGVLEPDAEARVESLVRDDRDWARAHEALRAALPSVAADLASVGPEPMPAPVLTASLQALAAERSAAAIGNPATGNPATGIPATGDRSRGTTRPTAGRPPTAKPASKPLSASRRARRRELGSALIGAFVLMLAGVGFLIHVNADNQSSTKGASVANAPRLTDAGTKNGSGASGAVKPGKGLLIVATGTNYTRLTLPGVYGTALPLSTVRSPLGATPRPEPQLTPAGLDRLENSDALDECLSAVTDATGGHPTLIDYAKYQGKPSLIIAISDINTVIAVGPDCGLPGHGIDEIARS